MSNDKELYFLNKLIDCVINNSTHSINLNYRSYIENETKVIITDNYKAEIFKNRSYVVSKLD